MSGCASGHGPGKMSPGDGACKGVGDEIGCPHMPTMMFELERWLLRRRSVAGSVLLALTLAACYTAAFAAGPKTHTVTFGAQKRVAYAPADATPDEKAVDTATVKIRPLIVDGRPREWTVGELHEVTDRSFVIRRMLRLNDRLPTETADRWVWEPGPWLLVDRIGGHITALHLPGFDPLISEVSWYRDYAAYCGVRTTAKGGLEVVVAQLGARKPLVEKVIGRWPQSERPNHVCEPSVWQRDPTRVTMEPTGGQAATFDVVGTTGLVEPADEGDGDAP